MSARILIDPTEQELQARQQQHFSRLQNRLNVLLGKQKHNRLSLKETREFFQAYREFREILQAGKRVI